MPRRLQDGNHTPYAHQDRWDPNDLLHPAQAFEHPSNVVNDPDLTPERKARDSCFVGIRRVRAGGSSTSALRPGQAAGFVRRGRGGIADVGQGSQCNGQRAISAHIASRPSRTRARTSSSSRETLDQLTHQHRLENVGGKHVA